MQTKGIRLWSKNHSLVSAPSIGRFFLPITIEPFFPFFLFRQLCLYISDSLHLFTLFLTDSLKKCQTKKLKNSLERGLEEAKIQGKALKRGKSFVFSKDTCLEKCRVQSKMTPRKMRVELKQSGIW